jgi:hypothetical protein
VSDRKASPPAPEPEPPNPSGKGRPTPKRKEAEAANRRPLVPADRAAARKLSKEEQVRARERMNRALQTGEERYLPARDKGVERRWTRDWVDSHTSISEFFLIAAIAMIVGMLALGRYPVAGAYMVLIMYIITFAFAVDAAVRGFQLRKALRRRFQARDIPRGTVWYGVSRTIKLRRTRLPKPQVRRGEHPD